MVEEILSNLYRIEVPLPQNPLRATNSYVIKEGGRSLIIDTGMNRKECMDAMSSGLEKLDIDLKKTDFFITHLHADHSGLVSTLATDTSTIYFNQADADRINSPNFGQRATDLALMNGFPEDEIQYAFQNHPGNRYSSKGHLDFNILKEGDTINIGDYLFTCIETPGHTNGHMCLYEHDKKLFVSGDHILNNITPNISLWSDDENPLNEYLASLDKIYDLDIKLVLPGHRGTFNNHKERIQELKHHHQTRANEVLSILKKGSKNAFQVASQMSWDLTYASWELFHIPQKWFATGEAISHLKYLEEKGHIKREIDKKKIVFLLK